MKIRSLVAIPVLCAASAHIIQAGVYDWQSIAGIVGLTLSLAFLVHLGSVYSASHPHKPMADLSPQGKILAQNEEVLRLIEKQCAPRSQPQEALSLQVFDMEVPFSGRYRLSPIFICLGTLAVPLVLWLLGFVMSTLLLLTLYGMYNAWKMGLQIAIYAVVGCKNVALYQNTDFKALHSAKQEEDATASWAHWSDVWHFVILPNYKEDPEVLRLAVESVASSGIAAEQICLVLAMEEREEGAKEKAEHLQATFHGRFKHCFITYHPAGLPNEMPGKSANTRWAANHVFETFMPQFKVDPAVTLLTVADADSEFSAGYFAALTYQFLSAGGAEGQTPQRQLTIWQPPILHMKNYIHQPAGVKWCSLITSLHELACLAEPNATRIPYSTYSISATLAMAVKGWDPDWISEDWHMALKCFLATGGRLKIAPIFLPILNYAPEGETFTETHSARWAQAKRHALGFAELVYFLDHFTRILCSIDNVSDKATFVWRSVFLWGNCLMTHLVMATFWFLAPFNAFLSVWYVNALRQGGTMDISTGSLFLANCMVQIVTGLAFVGVCMASVVVYECVKDRIRGSQEASLSRRWGSTYINGFVTVVEIGVWLPIFFVVAAACEGIAALKCSQTHRFDYEVALKPNLSKEIADSKSESTVSGDSASEPAEPSEIGSDDAVTQEPEARA